MPRPGWLVQSCATWPSSADACSGTCSIKPVPMPLTPACAVTPTVLLEVEATLQAALVDLAGALPFATVASCDRSRTAASGGGHGSTTASWRRLAELRHAEVAAEAAEPERPAVEDELAPGGVPWPIAGPSSSST